MFWKRRPASPLDHVKKELERVLERERQDADEKQSNRWHWGHVGDDVRSAVIAAEAVLEFPSQATDPLDYLKEKIVMLQRARKEYRWAEEDESGGSCRAATGSWLTTGFWR